MDKKERYIYAVTKILPEKQRPETEKKLRNLIEGKLVEICDENRNEEENIEEVLTALGDPLLLAEKYRTKKRYLIGPENYDIYFLILKIVTAAIAFGITLAIAIGYFVNPPESLGEIFINYFGGLINALFQGFAWVTVVFALFEYFDVPIAKEFKNDKWSTLELPELPVKEALIKPIEPILGIIFAIFAVILFNTADHYIAVYIFSDDSPTRLIPLFDHLVFRSVIFYVNIMLAVGMTKEIIKLIVGKWTQSLALFNLVANVVSFILLLLFIRTENLWNEAFFNYWVTTGIIPGDVDPMLLWGKIINGFIILIAFAFLIDAIINIIKGIKNKGTQ